LTKGCSALLNGEPISWDEVFLSRVLRREPDMVDTCHGSLYSRVLGVMLTGFHDGDIAGMAVHVLPKGAWEEAGFEVVRFDPNRYIR
jgi:hypothetical protein